MSSFEKKLSIFVFCVAGVIALLTSSARASSPIWAGNVAGVVQVDGTDGGLGQTVNLGSVSAIAADSGGAVWVVSAGLLVRSEADAWQPVSWSLIDLGMPKAKLIRPDPYDSSVWVADDGHLMHVAPDGTRLTTLSVSQPVLDFGIGLDQSVWVLGSSSLSHYSGAGRSLGGVSVASALAGGTPLRMALDSLRSVVWLQGANRLVQLSLDDGSIKGSMVVPADIRGMALDQRTSVLWILTPNSVFGQPVSGSANSIDLLAAGIKSPSTLVFDTAGQSLWLTNSAGLSRIKVSNTDVTNLPLSNGMTLLAATPFAVSPNISLLPLDSTTSRPPLTLALSALCDGIACDLPQSYYKGFKFNASLAGSDISGQGAVDSANRIAQFALPSSSAPLAFKAQAVDAFGHSSNIIDESVTPSLAVMSSSGMMQREAAKPLTSGFTVSITVPASGASYQSPATVTVTATATSTGHTISKIQFYQGSTLIGTATASPYTIGWTSVPTGTYSLTAVATDSTNATATSSAVPITVYTPPVVAITVPAAGALFNAPTSVTLTATASDTNATISNVAFYNGSTLLATVTASPYTYSWANVAAGTYSLTAKVTNSFGASTTSAVTTVTVDALPTVAITSPASSVGFLGPSATVPITATATVSPGTISKVDFYQGSTKLGTSTTSPYTYSWTGVAVGTYSLTAIATNNANGTKTSTAIPISVYAAPVVSLTAPTAGTLFNAPGTIALQATASDTDATISSVAFYNGSTLLGTDTTSPYSYSWTSVPAGTYSLTAKATNNFGAVTTSSPTSITVDALPVVSITSPASGTGFDAPATIPMTASATDAIGTIKSVAFYNGSTLLGTVTASPWTYSWTGVAAGSYTLKAIATNNAGGTTTSTTVPVTVYTTPVVSLTAPATGALYNAPGSVTLTATATDTDATISSVSFYNGSTLISTVTSSPYTYNWTGVAAGSYTITAKATNSFGTTATSTAHTITVDTLPVVNITSPASGATFNGPVTVPITASASDTTGTISKVDFYQGSTKLGTATASPYTYSWSNVAPGSYSLTAVATNNASGTTTSTAIPITIHAAPVVSISSPATGTSYETPATIPLTAVATDSNSTISSVAFYNSSTLLGTVTSSPYTYNWTSVAAGSYSITAKATNAAGQVTTSSSIALTVDSAPTVKITSPTATSKYNGPATVTIDTSITETGKTSSVAFYNGSTLLGTVTASPFNYSWTSVAAGTYTISAIVTNSAGTTATSAPITFTVDALPTVALTSPTTGQTVAAPAAITLSATGTDSTGTLSSISFYQGSTLIKTVTAAPYTYAWTGVAAGTYSITAVATNNDGGTATSAPVSITVDPPPTISITAPVPTTIFAPSASIPITVSAATSNGSVSRVDYYAGTNLIGSSTTAPFSYTWTGATSGSYFLTAKVTDSVGLSATSAAVYAAVDSVDTCNQYTAQADITQPRLMAALHQLPILFEENSDQNINRGYRAHLPGESIQFNSDKISFSFSGLSNFKDFDTIDLAPIAPSTARRLVAESLSETIVNYIDLADPAASRRKIPSFTRLRYQGIYSGIDMVFRGTDRALEYDFSVAPYADPKAIALEVKGASKLALNSSGELRITVGDHELLQRIPEIYQVIDGSRRKISGGFTLLSDNSFGFKVGEYDPAFSLTIDPVFAYYFTLPTAPQYVNYGFTVDHCGEAIVTGTANEGGNTPGPFIGKINPTGTALVATTTFGGAGVFFGPVTTDAAGHVYVAGTTALSNNGDGEDTALPTFPIISASFGTGRPSGQGNLIVAKYSSDLQALLGAAQFNTNAWETPIGIAVDASNNIYVDGHTYSSNFPTTPGAYQTAFNPGIQPMNLNIFVAKLNPSETSLAYATYIGTANGETATGLSVDASESAYVSGNATSDYPTTSGAYRTTNGATNQPLSDGAVLTKLNPAGSGLTYSTFGIGTIGGMTLDSKGQVHTTGVVGYPAHVVDQGVVEIGFGNSGTQPGTLTTYCAALGGGTSGGYVATYSADGSAVNATTIWGYACPYATESTYPVPPNPPLGGAGNFIALDKNGNTYVLGQYMNPVTGYEGSFSPFVMKLEGNGVSLLDTVNLAQQGAESLGQQPGGPPLLGLAVDSSDHIYVGGDSPVLTGFTATTAVISLGLDRDTSITLTINTDGQTPYQTGSYSTFNAVISGAGPPYTGTVNWINQQTGAVLGTSTVNGNTASFDATNLPPSSSGYGYLIQAVYSGDANNPGSSSNVVAWLRQLGGIAGDVTIASPANGSSFTSLANVGLSTTVTGTAYPVASVEYTVNGSIAGTVSAASPYTFPLTDLSPNTYTVIAYAIDTQGDYYSSPPVTFTVVAQSASAPQVALVSPAPSTQVAQPAAFMLVANALPSSGRTITSVSFYRDGTTLLGTATAAPYSITVPSTSIGTYNLTAVATDNTGATGGSALVTVQVVQGDATPSETITFLHSDLEGSPIAATDEGGNLLWRESYGPFGERILNEQTAQVNRQFFHVKPSDAESGLSYFGARFYDPVIGRFLGADPKGFDEKSIYSFGRYTYGNNNPYRYRDPDGRSPEEEETLREAGMSRSSLGESAKTVADVASKTGDVIVEGYEIGAAGEITKPVEAAIGIGRALEAGDAGAFGALKGTAGDGLEAHHMPQAALGFTSRSEGGALVMTQSEHAATRTYFSKGAATAKADAGSSFRDVLAKDIRDVRSIVGKKYNEGLQAVTQYYKDNFPNLMSK